MGYNGNLLSILCPTWTCLLAMKPNGGIWPADKNGVHLAAKLLQNLKAFK